MKNFKSKSKKFAAVFMALVTGVASNKGICWAEKSTNGEVDFCMEALEKLPQRGEPGFEDTIGLPSEGELNEQRVVKVTHKDGKEEELTINEKQVYGEIKQVVDSLITEAKKEHPGLNEEDLKICIAEKIYHWISQNIIYDRYESRIPKGSFIEKIMDILNYFVPMTCKDFVRNSRQIKDCIAEAVYEYKGLEGEALNGEVNKIYKQAAIKNVEQQYALLDDEEFERREKEMKAYIALAKGASKQDSDEIEKEYQRILQNKAKIQETIFTRKVNVLIQNISNQVLPMTFEEFAQKLEQTKRLIANEVRKNLKLDPKRSDFLKRCREIYGKVLCNHTKYQCALLNDEEFKQQEKKIKAYIALTSGKKDSREIDKMYQQMMQMSKTISKEAILNGLGCQNPQMPDTKNPQDAISVYYSKEAVCLGFSNLAKLMGRMAEIPAISVANVCVVGDVGHVFNLYYLKGCWVWVDVTFGSRVLHENYPLSGTDGYILKKCEIPDEIIDDAIKNGGFVEPGFFGQPPISSEVINGYESAKYFPAAYSFFPELLEALIKGKAGAEEIDYGKFLLQKDDFDDFKKLGDECNRQYFEEDRYNLVGHFEVSDGIVRDGSQYVFWYPHLGDLDCALVRGTDKDGKNIVALGVNYLASKQPKEVLQMRNIERFNLLFVPLGIPKKTKELTEFEEKQGFRADFKYIGYNVLCITPTRDGELVMPEVYIRLCDILGVKYIGFLEDSSVYTIGDRESITVVIGDEEDEFTLLDGIERNKALICEVSTDMWKDALEFFASAKAEEATETEDAENSEVPVVTETESVKAEAAAVEATETEDAENSEVPVATETESVKAEAAAEEATETESAENSEVNTGIEATEPEAKVAGTAE